MATTLQGVLNLHIWNALRIGIHQTFLSLLYSIAPRCEYGTIEDVDSEEFDAQGSNCWNITMFWTFRRRAL
jgi:hypothetical protein